MTYKRVRDTSRLSYSEVKETGKAATEKQQVYNYLRAHWATDNEGMRALGVTDPNSYRPRRTELTDEGKVKPVMINGVKYRRRDPQTRKLNIVWTAVKGLE